MNDLVALQTRIDTFIALQFEQFKDHKSGQLIPAITYSLLNGGKRMRPRMVYATAQSTGLDWAIADYIAAAIEMIHAYSLIHDDLPAMDNDDLRRGQATCHIAFDEATAILAGDALQAMAFETLTQAPVPDSTIVRLIRNLSQAAGPAGMVGGQMLDLEAENQASPLDELRHIHALKTGALLTACVTMVIDCSPELSAEEQEHYQQFAQNFGMAYQITDDIIDVTSDTQTLGKPAQSDIKNNKSTYPSLLGLSGARDMAQQQLTTAKQHLTTLPATEHLKQLVDQIANRTH